MPQLTRDEISQACEQADTFLRDNSADSKARIRLRLQLEEALLRFLEKLGPETDFSLRMEKRFGSVKLRLSVSGAMLDPFADSESTDEEDYLRRALVRMGQAPVWRYSHGRNVVLFTLPGKRLPDWIKLSAAVVAALVCGWLVRQLPDAAGVFLRQEIVTPLMSTYLGFLSAIAAPMIFLSVVWGIYSIGDAATFSVLGRKLVGRYALSLCLWVGLSALLSRPFFSLNMGAAQGKGLSVLFGMILDIVPTNLFTPFSRGNTLQILFVAVVAGIAMISISDRTDTVAALMEQLGFIVNSIMGAIGRLVPLFIFGSLFNIVSDNETDVLKNAGKFFFGTVAVCAIMLVVYTAATCVRMRCGPMDLWKKAISTFVIGLTTASSTAALADDLKTCTEGYGVSPKLANFAVPLGQIIFKPGNAVMYFFAAVSAAESGGVPVSLSWFVILFIMCIVLSSSTPPITGGSTASFSILFVQLGLPMESLPVILAINAILNYFRTATSLFVQQCVLVDTARGLGMIEKS